MSKQPSDALMHKYLLGNATTEETAALENAYSEDSEVFDRLMELDDELVDRYLDGTLTTSERQDYERSFEMFPRRRGQIELVRDLEARARTASRTSGEPARATVARHSGSERWFGRSWTFGLAAASLVLAAGAGVLVVRQSGLQQQLADARARETALRGDVASALEAASRARERAEAVVASGPPASDVGTERGAPVVAVTLLPGLLRDGTPPLVTVPQGALIVRADLVLPGVPATRYRVSLTTEAGVERWTQQDVIAVERAGRRVLSVDIPVTALPRGQLVLAVAGRTDAGTAVAAGEFHFRVAGR